MEEKICDSRKNERTAFDIVYGDITDKSVLKKLRKRSVVPQNGDVLVRDAVKIMMKDGNFIVPKGVIGIGISAFRDCSDLTSIELPNGVRFISGGAFANTGLTKIDIPDSVETIGYSAFRDCKNLKNINMPAELQEIGHSAFSKCSGLVSIDIPSKVASIKRDAFEDCSGLRTVKFMPVNTELEIQYGAFFHVTATVYYHSSNANAPWVGKDYGGNLTWIPYD